MKFVLCTVIVALACVTLCQSLTQIWGRRMPGDHVLYGRNIIVYPKARATQMQTIQFPPSGRSNAKLISAIYAMDNWKNQTGFMPMLKRGGPSRPFANIELRGFYGKGFNATVLIYGS
ncbi:uncharacterized protein [Musca autumnalis]|uniref:uncharacterized protein n=1 Tax=Musca autumnalis TaxID=221902 RepID=UPI003CFA6903